MPYTYPEKFIETKLLCRFYKFLVDRGTGTMVPVPRSTRNLLFLLEMMTMILRESMRSKRQRSRSRTHRL